VTVSVADGDYAITTRVVVGLLRMGFGAPTQPVRVLLSGSRLGVAGAGGTIWNPASGLTLR
jgi:hypothetical protein